jgi:hypothetical protein
MMNQSLKKILLLTSASAGLLTLSAVTADVASANGYASGSASVTNMDGSTYSVGGEVGGVAADTVTVTPTYTDVGTAGVKQNFTNLVVEANDVTGVSIATESIAAQVATDLDTLAVDTNDTNLSSYVSIVRAAAGADGLE